MTGRIAALRTRIVDGLQGAPELIVFGASDSYLDVLRQENRQLIDDQRRMSHIRGFSVALTTLVSGLTVGVVLYLGADGVYRREMDGADLALVAMATLAAFEGVIPLPAAYQFLGRTREAAHRLTEIAQTPAGVAFPETSVKAPDSYDIIFEGVGFRYAADAPPALEDISLHIPYGRRIFIEGDTGAGKTTLVNLLVRFWDPTEGRILIGGTDIRSYSEADLRRLISVVSQQAHLFSASIRDNLKIAREDASEAEMQRALAAARLITFVESLPDGLDTWIGENGRELSGGQARRLSVARALLRDTPVWVFDEPTEGLDTVTETELMASIHRHTRGKTLILITHRLASVNVSAVDLMPPDPAGPPREEHLPPAVVVLGRGRIIAARGIRSCI